MNTTLKEKCQFVTIKQLQPTFTIKKTLIA